MEKKTIGILGCGAIADTHVEAILDSVPDHVISVCDILPGKAKLLMKKYNLKGYYDNFEEMLEKEDLVSVHVLTPPQKHYENILMGIQNSCHILSEKPVCFSVDEVRQLYNIAESNNKILCVDHSLIHQPSVLKLFQHLKSEPNQEILYVNSFYGLDAGSLSLDTIIKDHWKRNIPGGPLIDTAIHPISLAVELTGPPIEINTTVLKNKEYLDELHINWHSKNSIINIIISHNSQPFRRYTEVITNKNTYIIDHSTDIFICLDEGYGPKALKKIQKNYQLSSQIARGTVNTVWRVVKKKIKENPGTRGVVEQFYKCVINNSEKIPISSENVINSTYVIESIIKIIGNNSVSINKNNNTDFNNYIKKDYNKSILITGISGFLGRHLYKQFENENYYVRGITRRGVNADKLKGKNLEILYEDFYLDDVDYKKIVSEIDIVIHCAHASGAKTWDKYKKINIDATLSLYEAAEKNKCEYFIFISSVAVYGVTYKGNEIITESFSTKNSYSNTDYYIKSKVEAENKLIDRAKNGKTKLIIIRPGILYSVNGERLTRKSIQLKNERYILSFGNGKNILPFNRVDVLAESIKYMIKMNILREGIYNFTGDQNLSQNDFVYNKMLKNGVVCKFICLPYYPIKIFAFIMENMFKILLKNKTSPINTYIINSSNRNMIYDSTLAKKTFGWSASKAVSD